MSQLSFNTLSASNIKVLKFLILQSFSLSVMLTSAGCSSASVEAEEQAPLSLSCEGIIVGAVGVTFASIAPTLQAGSSPTFFITPTLPTGLTLDSETGQITGVPSVAQAATPFTLLASNSLGQATCDFVALIDGTAPSSVTITPPSLQLTSKTNLLFTWSSSSDADSGIQKYEYSVGTSPGSQNLISWTDRALLLSQSISLPSLTTGMIFYFNVRTTSNTGLTTVNSSATITYIDPIYFEKAYFSSNVETGCWASDEGGCYRATYELKLYECSTSACTLIANNGDQPDFGYMGLSNPLGLAGIYATTSYSNSYSFCSAGNGCTAMSSQLSSFSPSSRDIGGSWGLNLSGGNVTCIGTTCTSLATNPTAAWGIKVPSGRFHATAASFLVQFVDYTEFKVLLMPGFGTIHSSAVYGKNLDKLWVVTNRSGQYYLVSCTSSACTEIESLGAIAPSSLHPSHANEAIWVRFASSLEYCTELLCNTLALPATGYSVVSPQNISIFGNQTLTSSPGLWLNKTGSLVYCSDTACTEALSSTSSALSFDGQGVGGWFSVGGNLRYCLGASCGASLGTSPSLSASKHTPNSMGHGLWITSASGIQYCTSTGCNLIDSSSADFLTVRSNRLAEGAWFYDEVNYTVKYCTSTSCSTLTRPVGMSLLRW